MASCSSKKDWQFAIGVFWCCWCSVVRVISIDFSRDGHRWNKVIDEHNEKYWAQMRSLWHTASYGIKFRKDVSNLDEELSVR